MNISYTKNNPYRSKILEKQLLVQKGSSKQTYHLVLDIQDSGIEYKPGDSVAIFPHNDPILVEHLIKALKATGCEEIIESRSKEKMTLRYFLSHKANLSRLTSSFLKLIHEKELSCEKKGELSALLQSENRSSLMKFLEDHDPLDVLKEWQTNELPLQEICNQFGPLLPRFYSISSSQSVHKDQLHLTVALFTFSHQGEQRFGVASHFLCKLAENHVTQVPMYIHPTQSFTLPEDPSSSIIMVGPGTGIAPFKAFLEERIHHNAPGKNWLFFGERNKISDFFYGEYLEKLTNEGKLRLDLAFSRDQEEKVYVQHKMLENSEDLWNWLESGAYFFVCGDAEKMAKDVEQALLTIAQKEGRLTEEQAKAYIKMLKASKRYRSDVY